MGGKEEKHFRKSADRGFTLVEMIITVTILVILAAILVPSMVGWVDRAQGKSYAVEARAVYLAAQTIESEHYDDSGKTDLEDAVIMKLEDGAWSKTDSMEDEGTGGDPTYDGDGEWPIGG